MSSVLPAVPTDSDDVVWALHTAQALWKRGDVADALLWLRRAAQAAGDASDDARALAIVKCAAALRDGLDAVAAPSQVPRVADVDETMLSVRTVPRETVAHGAEASVTDIDVGVDDARTDVDRPPPPSAGSVTAAPGPSESAERVSAISLLPDELSSAPPGYMQSAPVEIPKAPAVPSGASGNTAAPVGSSAGLRRPPPIPRTVPRPTSVAPRPASVAPRPIFRADRIESATTSSLPPPGDSSHTLAGVAPARDSSRVPPAPSAAVLDEPLAATATTGQRVWAPPAHVLADDSGAANVGGFELPLAPAGASEPALADRLSPLVEVEAPAPAEVAPVAPPAASATPRAELPTDAGEAGEAPDPLARALEAHPLFAAWTGDQREAALALVHLAEVGVDDEVPPCALAVVLAGRARVGAAMMDVAAGTLRAGDVLRTRGTLDVRVALRLAGHVQGTRVAYWTDADLAVASDEFAAIDAGLRAAADPMQARCGASIGALGERLDADLLAAVFEPLELRRVAAGEVVIEAGKPHPGLVVVGAGELDLEGGVADGSSLGSGEFLFPEQVMSGGKAPSTVRGGVKGALLLVGSRAVAQELFVTCAPLLEIFAGG